MYLPAAEHQIERTLLRVGRTALISQYIIHGSASEASVISTTAFSFSMSASFSGTIAWHIRLRAGRSSPLRLEDLQAVLSRKKAHTPRKKTVTKAEPPKVNLLVDIQAKLQAGKGAGYARWAKVFKFLRISCLAVCHIDLTGLGIIYDVSTQNSNLCHALFSRFDLTEYAKLLEEKKKTYAEYRRSREEMRELLTAKDNVAPYTGDCERTNRIIREI